MLRMLAGERTEVRFAPRAPAGRHVRLEELAERHPAARAAPDGILEEGDRTVRVAGRAVDVPQVGGERDHGGEDPAALEHRDDGAGLACHADTAATSGHTAHSGHDVPVRTGASAHRRAFWGLPMLRRAADTGRAAEVDNGVRLRFPQEVSQMKVLKRVSLALALSAPLAVLPPSGALAETLVPFTALLNGPQQVPPENSPSQGVALVVLVKDTNVVCWRISYSPLAGTETVAHFHGPAAPGQNAAILVNITPVPSPVGSPKHACVPFTKDQVKLLTKGLLYINIHSSVALNGEIRGQVLPDKVKYKNVPAPTSPSGAFLE
jgi:CHRD domain